MSFKRKISVMTVVNEALQDMGIQHTNDVPWMIRLCYTAARKIGSYQTYERMVKCIPIKDCRAELPCGFVELNGFMLGTGQFPPYSLRDFHLIKDGSGTSQTRFTIDGDFMNFGSDIKNKEVTIEYLGFPLDDNGRPLIQDNHEFAISQFIKWQYAERSQFMPEKINIGMLDRFREEWKRQAANARGEDGMPTEHQVRMISRFWNSLVPLSPNHEYSGYKLV